MSGDGGELAGLLRWYPTSWRDRYGDELVALLEDELDGSRPTVRLRASLVLAGLRERARAANGVGVGGTPEARLRAAMLVVLGAWSALVIGGAAFAKSSEHFAEAQPAHAQSIARGAFVAVAGAAVVAACLVAMAMAVAFPAAVRHLRSGGWPHVRRPIRRALGASGIAAVATSAMAVWAHHMDLPQRNGGNVGYGLAFLAWVLLLVANVGLWTAAGVAVARRIDLGRTALRIEAVLAVAVAVVVGAMTAAVSLWWVAMAQGAPWFLAGTRPGTHPSPVTVQLVVIEGWLVAATAVAVFGGVRVIRSLRAV